MSKNGITNEECVHSLLTLPSHLIILIFSYCDCKSLSSLSQCSRKLNAIINDDYVWLLKSKSVIASNQQSPLIKSRSSVILNAREKCKISKHWKIGYYKEDYLVNHRQRYIPWIELESKYLWFSKGNAILKYFRCPKTGRIKGKPIHRLSRSYEDLCRFIVKDNFVFCGSRNGNIYSWNKYSGKCLLNYYNAHSLDISGVDCYKSRTLISVSKDKMAKVWTINNNRVSPLKIKCKYQIPINDRIWCVTINEYKQQFCVGTAGGDPKGSLLLYDIESGKYLYDLRDNDYRQWAGILHALCESDHQLLSCGYDTIIRLWDMRTQKCVMSFEDPHNSTVYCIASDQNISILSGTARHGLVRLWDKRYSKDSIQMYYTGRDNSPVYSVSFDPCFAYAALDRSINLLSFLGKY